MDLGTSKCRGCYHWTSCCAKSLQSEACGDGNDPENGYAPLIQDTQGYTDFMRKSGHYIVERPAPKVEAEDYRMEIVNDDVDLTKSNDWAIATAAWQKVRPSKKAKYVRMAMSRHRRSGEAISAGKYARRAPREFKERIMSKGFVAIAQEFGEEVAKSIFHEEELRHMADLRPGSRVYGNMMKAMKDGKAPKAKVEKPRGAPGNTGPKSQGAQPAAHSALYRKVRENMQKQHTHPDARAKAAHHGGGSVFHHSRLSEKAGVPSDQIKKMALDSHHSDHFLQRVRAQFGDSVKDISDGQIRSAYHSTGLRHSMANDNDLMKCNCPHGRCTNPKHKKKDMRKGMVEDVSAEEKRLASKVMKTPGAIKRATPAARKDVYRAMDRSARGPGKVTAKSMDVDLMEAADLLEKSQHGDKCRVLAHTTSGKPIHADGPYHKGFSREDHEEAEEVHDKLASKLSNAASRWGDTSLPIGSRKYLQGLADHHRGMAMGHSRHAHPMSDNVGPTIAVNQGPKIPAHFGLNDKVKKSVINNGMLTTASSQASAYDMLAPKILDY